MAHGTRSLADYFTADHRRLDAFLAQALEGEPAPDMEAFAAFRAGLLRHIGMEEKVLFRAAREARGGDALPLAARLRVDHGALALLLVPTPTRDLIAEILTILRPHNHVEEEPGGMYDACDALLHDRAAELLETLRAFPVPPLNPHYDGPAAVRTAADALRMSSGQRLK